MSTAVYREDDHVVAEQTQWLLSAAMIYLALPVTLFALWWLNTGAAIVVTCLIAYGVVSSWKVNEIEVSGWQACKDLFKNQAAVFAILLLWCALSGTGGIGFQNTDYAASNALLKDLVQSKWPLRMHSNTPMVYYVMYYLPAAVVGKYLSWQAANLFLFAWTYVGLILMWSLLSIAIRIDILSHARKIMAVLAFILFGGWDIFGAQLNYGPDGIHPGSHIEWWASIGQFSSPTTLLFWVPQHTIAPWLVTATLILTIQRGIGHRLVWFLSALSFLWSPIASIGLLPFLFVILLNEIRAGRSTSLFSTSNFFVGPFLALLGVLYYSSNAFKFPNHWQFSEDGFGRNYSLLFLFEILTMALPFLSQHLKAKVYLNQINLPPPVPLNLNEKLLGWFAILILLLLPTYKMGFMNDLCMRASIPAVLVLFSFWVKILRKEFTLQYIPLTTTLICALFGSGSSIQEIHRSIANYSVQIPDINAVASLLNSPDNSIVEQRAGKSDSLFWKWLGPQSE